MAEVTIGQVTINTDDVVSFQVKDRLLMDSLGLMLAALMAFLLSCVLDWVGTAIGLLLVAAYFIWKQGELFGDRTSFVVSVELRTGDRIRVKGLTKAEALHARHRISKHLAK